MPHRADIPGGVVRGAGDDTAFRLAARVLDIAPVPVCYVSARLVVLQCNASAASLLGTTAEALLGQPFESIGESNHVLFSAARDAAASREAVKAAVRSPVGVELGVATCTPDIDAKGHLLGVIVSVTPPTRAPGEKAIAEQSTALTDELARSQRMQRELVRNIETLRAVVENSMDGIVIGTTEGRAVLYSPSMASLTGYSMSEINEGGWFDLLYPEPEERAEAIRIAEIGVREGPIDIETELVRKDGERKRVRFRMTGVVVGGQNLALVVASDVTPRHEAELAVEASEMLFRTIFELSPAGIAQVDDTGHIVRVNHRFAEMLGYSVDELAAKSLQDITHPDDMELDRTAIRSLAQGERDSFTIEKRYICADGMFLWALLSVGAIRRPDGSLEYMAGVIQDISNRKRAEELSVACSRIDSALHSTLELADLMERLVVEAARALRCDWGRVLMRTDDHWITEYGYRLSPDTEDASYSHSDIPALSLSADRHMVVAIEDLPSDPEGRGGILLREGVKSLLVVPLTSRDRVVGVIVFAYAAKRMRFTAEDTAFAEHVATSAAAALENAQVYDAEHRVADTLQDAMIRMPERMDGIDFCWLYGSATHASRVGGDFLDLFRLGGNRIGILLGDVSGKGLEAAALTALMKSVVRAYAYEDESPARVMERLNRMVERETDAETFATVFFGVLDTDSGWMSYCCGGHPPGLIRRGDGTVRTLSAESSLVGALPDFEYVEGFEKLASDDTLLLYTDGLIEARNGDGELFGQERAEATLQAVPEDAGVKTVCSDVFEAAQSFAAGSLADDIALLAINLDAQAPT